MNFTREPIIETIITPKDGYKLAVRNSKGVDQEEYFVDALEVVSFGHSIFYRSLERPKSFLVPVSDYEVVEVKETRVVLKNVNLERSIKIGGGREVKAPRESAPEKQPEESVSSREETPQEVSSESRSEKKRDRRRPRRRRGLEDRHEKKSYEEQKVKEIPLTSAENSAEGGGASDETQVSSSMFSTLFPPPTTLISEKLSKYKDAALSEDNILSQPVEEPSQEKRKKEKDDYMQDGETQDFHRESSPLTEGPSFTSSSLPVDDSLSNDNRFRS